MYKQAELPAHCVVIVEDKFEFEGGSINYQLCPASCRFNEQKLKSDFADNVELVKMHLNNYGLAGLIAECDKNNGNISIEYYTNDKKEIKSVQVKKDVHFTLPKF